MPADLPTDRRVAPSILAADFARLGAQVREVMDAGARTIHVDIMDGHFVPALSMGPPVVGALADQVHDAGGLLDVHLMVERPERHVEAFAQAGADVHTARVTTVRGEAVDRFELTDASGCKLDANVEESIRQALATGVSPGRGRRRGRQGGGSRSRAATSPGATMEQQPPGMPEPPPAERPVEPREAPLGKP